MGIVKYFFPDSESVLIPDGNKYFTHFATALKYKSISPDIGVIPVPEYSKLSSIFMKLLGVRDIYGNVENSFFAKCFINHPCTIYDDKPYEKFHVSLRTLNILEPSLVDTPRKYYPKFIQDQISGFMLNDMSQRPYVMVEISNNRDYCQLSIEKTARIINRFHETFEFTTLITGKPQDSAKATKLKALLDTKSEFHITNTLDEFIAYVNKSTYVLAGDGGLGHIAGALGKKLVCLYGVTSVERWGVLGDNVIHLYDPYNVNNIFDNEILNALHKI